MAKAACTSSFRIRCLHTATATHEDVDHFLATLNKEERIRAERFRAAEDRRDYAAAHALLRRSLSAAAPGNSPESWTFATGEHGKPYIQPADGGPSDLQFNLSHTRNYVASVVGRRFEVGLDVESGSRLSNISDLLPGVLSIDEQDQIQSAAPADRKQLFLEFWVLKEAYLKALGTGLSDVLNQICFDLRKPGKISASLPEPSVNDWTFVLFRPRADCHMGLAIAGTLQPSALIATLECVGGETKPITPVRTSD